MGSTSIGDESSSQLPTRQYLAGALNTPTRVFQHQELDAVLRCKVHLDPPAAARAADRTMRGETPMDVV
jgi:hypothetical protein